jgi:hypothetical protein
MNAPRVMFEVELNGKATILLPSTTCPRDLLPAPGEARVWCFYEEDSEAFPVSVRLRVTRK